MYDSLNALLSPRIAFRDIGLIPIAIIIVLSTPCSLMNRMPFTVVECIRRIVSSTATCSTCVRIGIALGRKVIPVRAVGHGADMRLNECAIATALATD